jgi:hypothetical protein
VSALSKEFALLDEGFDAEDAEDAASSEKRELLCRAEIDMNDGPFRLDFSEQTPSVGVNVAQSYIDGRNSMGN